MNYTRASLEKELEEFKKGGVIQAWRSDTNTGRLEWHVLMLAYSRHWTKMTTPQISALVIGLRVGVNAALNPRPA